MEWLTNCIGEEYKRWTNRDKVFIASPTGSGKTYFILKQFLPYLSQKNKRILYLVNRKILKEQIEAEIYGIPQEQRECIRVELYQSIEQIFLNLIFNSDYYLPSGCHVSGDRRIELLGMFDCVVCDECHYFLADSNYNTNTIISFRLVNEYFSRKVRIFMSATVTEVQNYLLNLEGETIRGVNRTKIYGFASRSIIPEQLEIIKKPYIYEAERDYSYIQIRVINKNIDDIIDLVREEKGKWLIFVDTIDFGKKLEIKLKKCFKNNVFDEDEKNQDIVLFSSDYEKSEESLDEVNTVINENIFKAKVIISTAVMDNGINIKDSNLRNMIIIADNEVEFIQMLGRKRKDKRDFKLYIVRQPRVYFSTRQQQVQRYLRIAEEYFRPFRENVKKPLLKAEANELLSNIFAKEGWLIEKQHCATMQKIFNREINFKEAVKIFLQYRGCIYLNLLAMKNLDNLNIYYQNVLERFDAEGEEAFVKEQLEWLGKTAEEIDMIIEDSSMTTKEKYRECVLEKINEILDKPKEKDKIIAFKKEISDKLRYLVEAVEEENPERKKVIDSIRRNERPLSKKDMEFLNQYCDLPFRIEVEDGIYTFRKSENLYEL